MPRDINAYAQVGDVEGAITPANPLNVVDAGATAAGAGIGAVANAAVVDPAESGTIIALLKGILTQQLATKADIATMQDDSALIKADIADVKAVVGTVADTAWSGTGDATVIAALKAAKTA